MENESQALDHDFIIHQTEDINLRVASSGKRFANLIVDTIVCYIFRYLYVAGIVGAEPAAQNAAKLEVVFIGLILQIIYYAVTEKVFGKTLGKVFTKTRVVNLEGNEISWGQAFGRSFSRLVPLDAFTFLGNIPVGWHDKWADTRVINE